MGLWNKSHTRAVQIASKLLKEEHQDKRISKLDPSKRIDHMTTNPTDKHTRMMLEFKVTPTFTKHIQTATIKPVLNKAMGQDGLFVEALKLLPEQASRILSA